MSAAGTPRQWKAEPSSFDFMHGSSFHGDGAKALLDLDAVMKETLGQPSRG